MIQKEFANKLIEIIKQDENVIGLAAAGSWISGEMDEFSDLDLVLITKDKIAGDKQKMLDFAARPGDLLSGFTGEHVGEPRLLICMYDNPLLHVDIKFLTLPEFYSRVENPVILFERDKQLSSVINSTKPEWPMPDYQWIEDRIWTWVHYVAGKIERGEYFEAIDGLAIIRKVVLAPLLHVKNKSQPNGVRKAEMKFKSNELSDLISTLATYDKPFLIKALENTVRVYSSLRKELFSQGIILRDKTEKASLLYLNNISV